MRKPYITKEVMNRRKFNFSLALASVFPAFASAAEADFPIRIVVPYPPGGGTDIYARLYAQMLAPLLGQPVIVENRSGASGNIGSQHVVRAAPDGHTVLFNSSAYAVNPAVLPSMPFDVEKDLLPVSQASSQPLVMVINKEFGITTLQGLLDYAKTKPINFGTTSVGSLGQLIGEELFKRNQVQPVTVPYRGASEMLTALVSGQIHVGFTIPPLIKSYIDQGRLVVLATTGSERSVQFPKIRTLSEEGYPDLVGDQWLGFFMPAKTPMSIADKFQKAMATILKDPGVVKRLVDDGNSPVGSTPAEFKLFVDNEVRRWKRLAEQAGVKTKS